MSYTPIEKLSIKSAVGINSDSITSGGNWVSNTYTGAGELNDYAYVGCNLQVDESGTLYFDFSQDGTNWSTYPVTGFDVASGINEVHTAWKGGRYMRPRFVGVGGRTYFRLETYYSNLSLPLSAPLNQSLNPDQDASVVRAVSIGERPSGTYINIPADGEAFLTTTPLASGATYDSGVLNISNYTQVQTHIVCNENGTISFIFGSSSTMSGTTVGANGVERVITIPYTAADGFQMYSAPAFTPYIRYEFTNNGVSTTTQLFFDTKFLTKALSGQLLGLNATIAGGMVANLGRNVIVGKQSDGAFENVSVTETSNAAGVYHNLNVVSGARPSQIAGRTAVEVVIDGVTADNLAYTVTSGKTFYVTDMILTVDNSSNVVGSMKLRDGTTVAGAVKLPMLIGDPGGGGVSLVESLTKSFKEPLPFTTGIFINEVTGTLTISGLITGYEE